MDSYNHHHMMDTDYGNIAYGSGIPNQMHTSLPPDNMIMQQTTSENAKDIQYASRESIITTNISEHMEEYQQQPSIHQLQQQHVDNIPIHLGNGPVGISQTEVDTNQFINHPEPPIKDANSTAVPPIMVENLPLQIPVAVPSEMEVVQEDNSIVLTSELDIKAEEESVVVSPKTTALEIEPVVSAVGATDSNLSKIGGKADDNEVDQNQCRVCLSKINLVNIFTFENNVRISDIIMSVCTTVKIAERDFLPHYVCTSCLDKVKIAIDFKSTCENTDKELRTKLKRSKNKVRRRRDFILVDCEMSSGGSDDNGKDDDEFQISDEAVESEPYSDASFSISKKKKSTKPKKKIQKKKIIESKKRSSKSSPKTTSARSTRHSARTVETASSRNASAKRFRHDVVFVDAAPDLSDEPESEEDDRRNTRQRNTTKSSKTPTSKSIASKTPAANKSSKIPHKKRAIKPESADEDDDDNGSVSQTSSSKKESSHKKEHPCPLCDKVFPTQTALKDHKKVHVGEKPLACNICNKPFKQRVSLEAHIQKHKDDDSRTCKPCEKQFASRIELRKHQQSVHEDEYTFECEKCKRSFTTKSRLDKHKESKCPGFDTTVRKPKEVEVSSNLGRDLFKCVAPLTTTYWSDSFSE